MGSIGLVGAGAIGSSIIDSFQKGSVPGYSLLSILARSHQLDDLRRRVREETLVTDDQERFFSAKPDLVIEAAGHAAAIEVGVRTLSLGSSLYLLSVGILADPVVRNTLTRSARHSSALIVIPSGAFAGFDGLRALRQSGLSEVTYTSIKPPYAWDGTPGQELLRGRNHTEVVVIFDGSASEAARQFPKNANLAAAIAIAGIGFERTRVRLVSDPSALHNEGRIEARGTAAVLNLSLRGNAFESNPKSSRITGNSVISAILNSNECVRFY
jgi:aspartate dehydrogenase